LDDAVRCGRQRHGWFIVLDRQGRRRGRGQRGAGRVRKGEVDRFVGFVERVVEDRYVEGLLRLAGGKTDRAAGGREVRASRCSACRGGVVHRHRGAYRGVEHHGDARRTAGLACLVAGGREVDEEVVVEDGERGGGRSAERDARGVGQAQVDRL